MVKGFSKAFFGISLASIMLLSGFSFSSNFLPEADAAIAYPDWFEIQTRDIRDTVDYVKKVNIQVYPGYSAGMVVSCDGTDELAVTKYVPAIYGSEYWEYQVLIQEDRADRYLELADAYAVIYGEGSTQQTNYLRSAESALSYAEIYRGYMVDNYYNEPDVVADYFTYNYSYELNSNNLYEYKHVFNKSYLVIQNPTTDQYAYSALIIGCNVVS